MDGPPGSSNRASTSQSLERLHYLRIEVATASPLSGGANATLDPESMILVLVDVFGSKRNTGPQQLETPPGGFQSGRLDYFGLPPLPDLGSMQFLELALVRPPRSGAAVRGSAPPASLAWHVKHVRIENLTTGEKALFVVDGSLQLGQALRVPATNRRTCHYVVEVQTADVPGAGSVGPGAAVTCNLIGTQGQTGFFSLETPRNPSPPSPAPNLISNFPGVRSPFIRGALDAFQVSDLPDVGIPKVLDIGFASEAASSGGGGGGSSLLLSWVRVRNLDTGASATFPCDGWLSDNAAGPGGARRVLSTVAADKPNPNPGRSEENASVLHPTAPLSAPSPPRAAINPYHLSEAEARSQVFPRNDVSRAMDLIGMATSTSSSAATSKSTRGGYHLTFFTSNVCRAGASEDDTILFELSGKYGSSGVVVVHPEAVRAAAGGFPPPVFGPGDRGGARLNGASSSPFFDQSIGGYGYGGGYATPSSASGRSSGLTSFPSLQLDSAARLTSAVGTGHGPFVRGSIDLLSYPYMPNLGELTQLRVGLANQGLFTSWHLRLVEVTHVPSGAKYVFDCHAWIDKSSGWHRVMGAVRVA